jgi:hypothetical protein
MSERTMTVCDFCGVAKKDSNHWWTLALFRKQLYIAHFGDVEHTNADHKDACGENCIQIGVSRFLDHDDLEPKES